MEYEYKQFERATLAELAKMATLRDIGKTTGHHGKLKIGDASVKVDKRMNYPIFEVLNKADEIIGYYVHTSKIDIPTDDEIDCPEF